ncbi:MAG: ATP-dependent DNA helicase PcrA [Micrococcales bacterium 73-15]|uniref:UvrD-helicase domain-containing protein n=1 Tax=Salana multivorans TaxID=120377 RepID=UPI000958FFD2|nr:UvrD-helicase domain-containing protein [Salana multivorans]OJX97832.1 MAG: ATP-dependent DNA helicase PcrA [Micrococcales bacterium 73-15]
MNNLFDGLAGLSSLTAPASGSTHDRAAGAVLPGIVPANRDAAAARGGGTGAEPDARGERPGGARRGRPSPDDLVAGLNPQQREAVEHRGGPLLIVAGAGSGKTRVLTNRIAHLLATGEARPGEILAITFTNKAAAEMRERVEALVGPAARMMWVSTFHSACVRILRREHAALGLRSSFSIYDAADSQRLMQLVCREMDLDPKKFNPKAFSRKVSDLKNELIGPREFAATIADGNAFDSALAQAFERYQARLAQASALDFDDLIAQTVRLLREFPDIKESYRRRFRHVLVDEYQDTNHAQYVLVRELAGVETEGWDTRGAVLPTGQLTVVGDADQSIYAFRGATIRNILEFEEDYPNARTILLEQNYRSTQNILTAANAVIARNAGRRAKNLWTAEGAGPSIVGYVADSDHDESTFVVEEIDRLGDSDGVKPGDVAVFYRTNAQSRSLEERLVRAGIPYKVVGGTRFYERREIKDAIAYLHAVANPDDAVNVRRILNVPKRGLGERTEGTLAWFAERERISFGAAVERYAEVGLPPRAEKGVAGFAELMAGLRAMLEGGASAAEVLDAALDRSGYLAELRASDDPQDASRVENLAELHAVAEEFAQATPDGTLADFLERVSLVADADQIPLDDGGQGVVTLMTVHTAKGLEFPVVFVTGLEDGTFPHMRSLADPDQLAEERRLAYVALTRARQRLYLTRAAVRTSFGVPNQMPASRFIDDIPPEVLEWRREESATEAMRRGWAGDGYGSGGYGGYRSRRDDDGDFAPAYGSGARRGERGSTEPRGPRSFGDGAPASGGLGTGTSRGSAATRSTASADVPSLAVGDRVTHDSYGLGTVVSLEGAGSSSVAKVDFGSAGVKRLLLRYAPVTKL